MTNKSTTMYKANEKIDIILQGSQIIININGGQNIIKINIQTIHQHFHLFRSEEEKISLISEIRIQSSLKKVP